MRADDVKAFREELRDRGWIEGQNLAIELRFAEGQVGRLTSLVGDLLRLPPDVLVVETTPAVRAAMTATRTTPLVFTYVSDPIGAGFVSSLARPGGNATGFTNVMHELSGKLLELVREALPGTSRIAVLWNPDNPGKATDFRDLEAAASAVRNVRLQSFQVRAVSDLDPALARMAQARAEAVIVLTDALTTVHRRDLADLARKYRLPTMFSFIPNAEASGLMAFAPDFSDLYTRAAVYVDKILRGAKPGDLPVERPLRFKFVVNLRTAKALGLTIPPAVLARADQVIE